MNLYQLYNILNVQSVFVGFPFFGGRGGFTLFCGFPSLHVCYHYTVLYYVGHAVNPAAWSHTCKVGYEI